MGIFLIGLLMPFGLRQPESLQALNYTQIERKGEAVLPDVVKYTKKGRQKNIKGYDKIDPVNPHAFTWRGKGLRSLYSSQWEIILKKPEGETPILSSLNIPVSAAFDWEK